MRSSVSLRERLGAVTAGCNSSAEPTVLLETRVADLSVARGGLEANLHFRSYVAALLVAWVGSVVMAQKITTPEELDKTMKKVQQANQAANKAVGSGNFPEAAKQLSIVKQAIIDSREFWIQHKKDDAIAANKEVVAKIETVEKLLTAPSPDAQAVQAAFKQEIGAACRQCHEKYRVRDAENNWVLKPGSIGG